MILYANKQTVDVTLVEEQPFTHKKKKKTASSKTTTAKEKGKAKSKDITIAKMSDKGKTSK